MEKRKSSIHIESGETHEFLHNTREIKVENSVFTTENNYVNINAENAIKLYNNLLQERIKLYTKRTHKKLHKNTKTLLTSEINLNEQHTKEDVEKIVEFLEKTLNTKVIQYALHFDEGHTTQEGEKIINYHAHILFMGIDNEGRSVRKKLDRKMLKNLQTEVANLLKMERGDPNRKAHRMGAYDYKKYKKTMEENKLLQKKLREEKEKNLKLEEENKKLKEELAKQKDLKELNQILRQELKKLGATRKDYAKLEQTIKNLKEQIKNKDLKIDELLEKLATFENQFNIKITLETITTLPINDKVKFYEKHNIDLNKLDNIDDLTDEQIEYLKDMLNNNNSNHTKQKTILKRLN